ncbi:endonuclease [Bacillus phage Moonbeam]|uniref:Endonuclease n=1 Tax=Bacillus phage Moonbeam TaxID=1540091 RepID=A0A0A0RP66_9CAUD|nr:endonuclease [Bacillus phage Moonbeam]AIW03424.1 endonuclease [Bacillus phage Moonbeam]
MLVSKYGYRRNYKKEWTRRLVTELNNSEHYVLVKCDDCSRLFKTMWSNRKRRVVSGKLDLCRYCVKKGSRNPTYGKDRRDLLMYARTFAKQNPMQGRHHSPEARAKMSKRKVDAIANGDFDIKSNNRGQKEWHLSSKSNERFHADSILELLRMIQLDQDDTVALWTKRHGIKIPYQFDGVARYTTPDFLITYKDGREVVEEVKGRITDSELAKKEATAAWCAVNGLGYKFTTQKEMNKNGEYRKFLRDRRVNK